ncbi:hypothetical protein J3R82DRAFT_1947 [Butyriboletus roseoflavus]|nr:hypothetical protein J3R82DRAFT_1947 [Butyriboletus roseoflavus]
MPRVSHLPPFRDEFGSRLSLFFHILFLSFRHCGMSNFHFPYARFYPRLAVLLATAILILVAFPFNRSLTYSLLVYGRYPPLYPHHHQLQLELPHYESYEHSDIKYLWAPNHPSSMLPNTLRRKLR